MNHRAATNLSSAQAEALFEIAGSTHVSVTSALCASWVAVLRRWSGLENLAFQVCVTERPPIHIHLEVNSNTTVDALLSRANDVFSDLPTDREVRIEWDGPTFPGLTARGPALVLSDDLLAVVVAESDADDAAGLSVRLLDSWQVLSAALMTRRIATVDELPILTSTERQRVLFEFNSTAAPYPTNATISDLFEQQVQRTPDKVAVVCGHDSLSYRVLDRRANELACYLRRQGVGPDDLVALFTERNVDMVVALLGVLKSGGAYVPLDPAYPADRLAHILRDASPKVVLTQQRLSARLPQNEAVLVIALDTQWDAISQQFSADPPESVPALRPDHLAYVIYTSGSTGQPKGVAIEHRNTVNLLWWAHRSLDTSAFARTLLSTSLSFDLSVYECLVPLTCGGAVHVVDNALALLQGTSAGTLEPTLINTVPSAIATIADAQRIPAATRAINLAGEALRRDVVERIFASSDAERVCNLYGPSETTTYSTWVDMPRAGGFVPTIGRPIANTQIYILDERREPVPVGVVGEIYIGGAGVARGYLHRPELTEQRFLTDPFLAGDTGRMYRTGDLARWLPDGAIEYLGRNDHQVKIRGYRIELGEIEARLVMHPQVQDAAVIAREDVPGEKRLVAYLAGRDATPPEAEVLRAYLKSVLPEYMVPSAYVSMERLPQTPNGKLDRRALPAPQLDAYVASEYEAPQGEVERVLADIWQETLRVQRVGRRDNFFELGGDSLLIVQMMQRLRQAGFEADAQCLFSSQTLSNLASALNRRQSGRSVPPNRIPQDCTAITPSMLPLVSLEPKHIEKIAHAVPGGVANIQDVYPLAPLQEGILFHHLMDERGGDTYVLPTLLSMASWEHVERFIRALQNVIDRHDVLRTALLWEDLPQPVQVVYRRVSLPVEIVLLDRDRDAVAQLEERMRPERQRLDLRRAPLIRLQIAAAASGTQWFALLQLHHVIHDHESLDTMLAEVLACVDGRASDLPNPAPYRNHVFQALEHARTHDAEAFFKDKLAAVEETTAAFGQQDVRGDGSRIAEVSAALPVDLRDRVRALSKRIGVGPATLFHAAWALVVARTSGRDDVVFGTLLSGRLQGEASTERVLGMFINTLPLRLPLRDLDAMALIDRMQRELGELLNHEQASLTLAQRCSGVAAPAPLFNSLFNYVHGTLHLQIRPEDAVPGIDIVASREWTNYPVVMSVEDRGVDFVLTAQTDQRIDAGRVVAYLGAVVRSLVHALETESASAALSLEVLPEAERRELVESFNRTRADYSRDKLIHQFVEEQAVRAPESVAVICGDRRLTFDELNRKANRIAHTLLQRGVAPEDRVAVYADRSLELIAGLLGALKAGAAYLPLDPANPAERTTYMLRDAGAKLVLARKHAKATLPGADCTVLTLDDDADFRGAPEQDPDARQLGLTPRSLAYVIYTSGSTGMPKGVMIEHGGVVNLIQWHHSRFGLRPGDRCSYVAAVGFDASVLEIWPSLCVGATLVVAPASGTRDTEELLRWWESETLDLSFLPTPIAELAISRNRYSARLRTLLVGGDRLRSRPPAGSFELVNNYGPTEYSVVTTAGRIEDHDEVLHIGRPIANTHVYILDPQGQIVPIGVAGELHVGGVGVARGYLNRPELTAERFVRNPFGSDQHARLYKTGDVARWRSDGTIEYLGRNDQQVKIRGYRIELGEIETQLARHPQVGEAVVIVREDVPGQKRLVAYLTQTADAALQASELRAYLKPLLPEYMLPSAFLVLERLPLTANGKLDRRALPAPERDAHAASQYAAPRGDVEVLLANIWQEVLRVEQVGRNDNFFELGGHSLLIVQMLERLRRAGLSTEVRAVFESATLADLAQLLSGETSEEFEVPPNLIPAQCTAITPAMLPLVRLNQEHIDRIVNVVPGGARNVQDIYPLAPLQEGILFHHLMDEQGDTYVVANLLSLSSRERLQELMAAFQGVIDRHDALRTAVLWEDLPQAVQVVYRQASLPVEERQLDPTIDSLTQMKEWMKPERQRIDLRTAPLLRLQIAADPHSPQWFALLQFHHIVCDHVTVEVVISEIVAHLNGRAVSLPESTPYRVHVAQAIAYASTHDAETFFRSKLADVDEPTAPFGLIDVHGDVGQIEEATEPLEPDLARRVRVQARRSSVNAATLFHAAWALVAARTSRRDDVVFGSVLMGQLQGTASAQRILGMFINTLPLRLRLREVSTTGLIEQTHRELIELLNHEQASLSVAQRCSAITGSAPLFSTLLNFRHGAPSSDAEWTGAGGIRVLVDQERTNFPITVSVDDLSEGFSLTAQTDRRIDPRRVTGYLHAAIASLVDSLEQGGRQPALDLSVLPEHERCLITETFSATDTSYPADCLIHEMFEQQARLSPNTLALLHGQRSLTYGELNVRANQLARYLRAQGVGADQIVGICVERSPEMVIGVLGILKAGAAYMPLDPSYPRERLQYMIEDAAPNAVLVQESLQEALQPSRPKSIVLEQRKRQIAAFDTENLSAAECDTRNPQRLLYVIYTSGSTGRPKGTAMSHGAMVNLMEWHRRTLPLRTGQRVLQFAALSFDVAFQEIFSTLSAGGTLVLLDEWMRRDIPALTELLEEHRVGRLFLPPLMLQSLAEHYQATGTTPKHVRDVITAGEQLRISPEISQLFAQLPGGRLHNHYGPTETHVVTALTLDGDPHAWPSLPSIGRPVVNCRVAIVDSKQRLLPIGVPGEIYLGGAGLARGYLGRPELTAQRFVADVSGDASARWYKTGDVGCWRADGTIEYLGRNDEQVKIRGYRVELGEVTARLSREPGVKEAIVVMREDAPGQKRLIAYVVPRDLHGAADIELWRSALQSTLPEYMIPTAFVVLDRLPVTPSGKLDRRSLPAPDLSAQAGRHYEAPQGELEETLAAIWRSVLRVERIGRQDNFFELGGHSLLAMQMMVRVRAALSVELPMRALFKHPVLQQLAAHLSEMQHEVLLDELAEGSDEMEQLLAEVAAMPEGSVKQLVEKLRMEGRP